MYDNIQTYIVCISNTVLHTYMLYYYSQYIRNVHFAYNVLNNDFYCLLLYYNSIRIRLIYGNCIILNIRYVVISCYEMFTSLQYACLHRGHEGVFVN